MRLQNNYDISKTQWTHPMGLKELSRIFDVHRNTMSKWLKSQTIRNRKMSPRKWEIATFELPYNSSQDDMKLISQENVNDFY